MVVRRCLCLSSFPPLSCSITTFKCNSESKHLLPRAIDIMVEEVIGLRGTRRKVYPCQQLAAEPCGTLITGKPARKGLASVCRVTRTATTYASVREKFLFRPRGITVPSWKQKHLLHKSSPVALTVCFLHWRQWASVVSRGVGRRQWVEWAWYPHPLARHVTAQCGSKRHVRVFRAHQNSVLCCRLGTLLFLKKI